jgi:hypothetical protein
MRQEPEWLCDTIADVVALAPFGGIEETAHDVEVLAALGASQLSPQPLGLKVCGSRLILVWLSVLQRIEDVPDENALPFLNVLAAKVLFEAVER